MNFVDAAIALLKETDRPLHVEEMCRLALERGLLDNPGKAPLRSFKGRLTTELRRGDESRVVKVDGDVWQLRSAAEEEEEAAAEAAGGEGEGEAAPEEARARAGEAEEVSAGFEPEDVEEEEAEDEEPEGEEPEGEDSGAEASAAARPALTPEEEELAAVYADETETASVATLSEYRDEQTADEDRLMLPEITQERRGGRGREDWKARRERIRAERQKRREQREATRNHRGNGAGAGAGAGAGHAQAATALAPAAEFVQGQAPAPMPLGNQSAELARRATEVLASIRGGQPVPVKQLAQMMRKRHLAGGDPERIWRPLKAALLAEQQRRLASGLPVRVAYRGRDLFAYRGSANAEIEAAEDSLELAAHRLRGATERTLAARLANLDLPVLEQVAQLYLSQIGWRDLEWIKRVGRTGYAVAQEPGGSQAVLVGVRAGNQEVDRRGVGELRAGVEAKELGRGLLLAPRELGDEAETELERPGRPVSVLCGLTWAAELVAAGVGVAVRALPVTYLDTELFERLGDS